MTRKAEAVRHDSGIALAAALTVALVAVPLAGPIAVLIAAGLPVLPGDVEQGWQAYVAATEAQRASAAASPSHFLVLDQHRGERSSVLAGDVLVQSVAPPAGAPGTSPPGASVHHWRGAVYLPGTTVDQVVTSLERRPPAQEDVLQARVLSRGPSGMHVYLRLRRQQILTVVYDTEHDVRFTRHGPGRASSSSRAIRITEVRNAGASDERALTDAEDRDFLWRLHAYWRYQAVPGGVIAECESISLSRDVPFALRLVARPLITRTAQSSMRAALLALRGV